VSIGEERLRDAARTNSIVLTRGKRPKLDAENVDPYLDWIADNIGTHHGTVTEHHLRAAELLIRTKANEAQAKATQHTLVEQGIIDAPTIGPKPQVA